MLLEMRLYFDDTSDTLIIFHQDDNLTQFEIETGKEVMYIDVDPLDWTMEKVNSITVAIEENQSPVTFKIGQNQINDDITLYFSNKENSNKSISITDISGKIVYKGQTEISEFNINTTFLNSGVYIIRASDNKNTYVERFVK